MTTWKNHLWTDDMKTVNYNSDVEPDGWSIVNYNTDVEMMYQVPRQLTITWTTSKNSAVQQQAKRIVKKYRNLKRTTATQNNDDLGG